MHEEKGYWDHFFERRVSRRQLMRLGALGVAGLAAGAYLACRGEEGAPTTGTPAPRAGAVDLSKLNEWLGPGGPQAGQGQTIKLGVILALSGPGSYYGQIMTKGTDLGVEHVRAAGGPNFQVIYKDHKSGDVTAGATAARELVNDGVQIILSSYAAVLGSILPVIQPAKVLVLDGGGGTSQLWKRQDYFWGTRAVIPDDAFNGVVQYVRRKLPNARRVASVGWDVGPANEPVIAYLKQVLAANNMELVADERVQIGTTDYSTTLARVRGTNPDVILTGLWGLDPGYFMKQYVTSGMKAQVIGFEFTPDACQVAGAAYDQYWFAFDYFDIEQPFNPWSKLFIDAFRQKYNQNPDFYAANFYEKVFIVWELVRRVLSRNQPITGENLQNALKQNPTFKSLYGGDPNNVGTITFDLEEHDVDKLQVIGKVSGCKARVVAKMNRERLLQVLD
jgi:branched-chain amino acid transport system substrate-binding protein